MFKLTMEGPEVVLVSLLSTLIIFDTLFWFVVFFVCMFFLLALNVNGGWNTLLP